MKNEMRAFDVLAVVSESQSLVGGFVDKVFQWEGGNVLIRVNVKG
jgi:predicted ribosome quality control (RQC) complex YloA/Tae2 family protein